MGNDFTARKQRRKARRGDEESTRRIRKKKNQPRRLCRGIGLYRISITMSMRDSVGIKTAV